MYQECFTDAEILEFGLSRACRGWFTLAKVWITYLIPFEVIPVVLRSKTILCLQNLYEQQQHNTPNHIIRYNAKIKVMISTDTGK